MIFSLLICIKQKCPYRLLFIRYRSASIAALQPDAAAVIACLYRGSATSPAANTPSMLVCVQWQGKIRLWVNRNALHALCLCL